MRLAIDFLQYVYPFFGVKLGKHVNMLHNLHVSVWPPEQKHQRKKEAITWKKIFLSAQ